MQRISYFISLVSALLVLFLAGSAFFLSFESLKDLAVQIGIAEQIAWLYPAIIDGAIIVFSLSVLRANLTRERTMYPWVLVSGFTLLSVVLNIIHAQQELLAQFLAAIPPVALFLSFELLLAQLKETAVRLEAQNSLAEINREIKKKESELDKIVRERSETIEKLEGEIGRLTEHKNHLSSDMQNHSISQGIKKPSESVTIEHARQTRTAKKRELMQQLLETFRTKPNATLSELETAGLIQRSELGWTVSQSPGD